MHSFKKAVKSSMIFLILLIICTETIVYPYFHSETYHYQDGYVREELQGTLDFLICGASQAQRGISPMILDQKLGCNSYNIASPLMTLHSRYYMLEKELERNPVKTVIIELCYDTMGRDRAVVGPEGDYYMLGRFTSFTERLQYFISTARFDEYAEFYSDTLQRGITAWRALGENGIGTSEHYTNKGFAALEAQAIEPISKEMYQKEQISTEVVEENLDYLNKMFQLCREKNINVIVVATPLADAAILSYDKMDEIYSMYQEICQNWDYPYYDFSLYKGKSEFLNDADSYYDRNHLSDSGAERFTALLADIVKETLDGADMHELFYENYAQLYRIIKCK